MNDGPTIDLNADLGEGEATDALLLDIVTSCNVACGGHAGDAGSMARTMAAAIERGVVIGAHPSYPDRDGFGRRSGYTHAAALAVEIERQLGDLAGVAARSGAVVRHLKPHGALYNDAADDPALAHAICEALSAVDPGMRLVGLPDSALEAAARDAGISFVGEGFVDRAYRDDGRLVSRSEPGAVYSDPALAAAQAVDITLHRSVTATTGERIALNVRTLCIHGDSPGAVDSAKAVRAALAAAGVAIRALS